MLGERLLFLLQTSNLLERALQGFFIICANFFGRFDEPLRLLGIIGLCRLRGTDDFQSEMRLIVKIGSIFYAADSNHSANIRGAGFLSDFHKFDSAARSHAVAIARLIPFASPLKNKLTLS
jgi:hypothetical protein